MSGALGEVLAPLPQPGRTRGGVRVVLAWELEKLTAQVRTRLALAVCLLGPFAFAGALLLSGTAPADTLFGRWVHDSGFAVPLVVLGFAGSWGLPLLACLVAGDVFSAEDHLGTWPGLLTRSRGRGVLFAGKALAAGVWVGAAVLVLALASLTAGVLVEGTAPLVGLSGTLVPPGRASGLVLASWASVLPSTLAFGGLGLLLSVVTRSSLAGIVGPTLLGFVLQLLLLVDGLGWVRTALPGGGFVAWHGLFASPSFAGPLAVDLLVAAGWCVLALGVAWLSFRRRDVMGG